MSNSVESRLGHYCFPQPSARTASVWRYLPLSSFISLLDQRRLPLIRLDKLKDQHEGSITYEMADLRDRHFASLGAAEYVPSMGLLNRMFRASIYVSCWCLSEDESEALWRLYSGPSEGVAIRSQYQALVDVIAADDRLFVGKVSYDPPTCKDQSDGASRSMASLAHAMRKRRSFLYEQEVRLLRSDMGIRNDGESFQTLDTMQTRNPDVVYASVDIESLIHGICIHPYAPDWFADVVKSTVSRFAPSLAQVVSRSSMSLDPHF